MNRIIQALHEINPEHDYSASDDFIKDRFLDSFDVVVLVKKLEDRYGISIDGEDVTPENFKNIAAINLLIERYANVDEL